MSQSHLGAVSPITEDDSFIADALESASIPTLMMSMVHMSDDLEILRGPIRPGPAMMSDVQGAMSDEDKAAVRAHALEIIRAYRDAGCPIPPPPPPETLHEMMNFMVGQPVPDAYVPMMLEEMALDGEDSREAHWSKRSSAGRDRDFHVVIIGAGMSGVLAAIRLEQAGVAYTVIEKNEGVGGTWFENTYPGCRVDIANHFYCYSFEPNHDWGEFFSQRAELRDYFERCAESYGVRDHIRFETEVVSARFDESNSTWALRVRSSQGALETLHANVLISAVGQLNRPKIPEFEGLGSFEGPSFHSAAWQPEHDLEGKRVAVIGTGASAFQLVPEVAKTAKHLTVFQRSPVWMFPNPKYHQKVSEGKKWLLRHLPYYGRWYRFLIFWPGSDGLHPSLQVDPAWPHFERSINALNEGMRGVFTKWMKSQLGDDSELLEKVVPPYPPFAKRMLQDNGSWLSTLRMDHVELVTDGIDRIESDAIVCEGGGRHAVDVIVFATGFHANRFLWPMRIEGKGGAKLHEVWGEDPRAYLGITVPGFPNLFCLYGPATNLAHAGSIIFHSECQVRYIMGCIRALLDEGLTSMECKQAVHDEYNSRLDEALANMVWSHPGVDSWYKNRKGKVTTTSPWRLLDYWSWTREPNVSDYDCCD